MRRRTPHLLTAVAAMIATVVLGGCANDTQGPAEAPASSDSPAPADVPGSSSASAPSAAATRPTATSRPGATAPPAATAPFIAAADWADSDFGVTLTIAPTPAGRQAWGPLDPDAAWQEVLRLAPDADTAGMREQFDCHWTWARILEPDKPTWNIEPWRPVVGADRMLAEGCNPGGPEV